MENHFDVFQSEICTINNCAGFYWAVDGISVYMVVKIGKCEKRFGKCAKVVNGVNGVWAQIITVYELNDPYLFGVRGLFVFNSLVECDKFCWKSGIALLCPSWRFLCRALADYVVHLYSRPERHGLRIQSDAMGAFTIRYNAKQAQKAKHWWWKRFDNANGKRSFHISPVSKRNEINVLQHPIRFDSIRFDF